MLIATPNERLNYSLSIYRRNWHMIFVLTSSQQQKMKFMQRPGRRQGKNFKLQMQSSIYE